MYYINNRMFQKIALEYDPEKNQRNIVERGLPFDLAELGPIRMLFMKWMIGKIMANSV